MGDRPTSESEKRRSASGRRFLIADDHPLFRGALHQTLAAQFPDARIEEAGALDALLALLAADDDAELILLDLGMPGMQHFSGLLFLRAEYPNLPVLVVSGSEEPEIIRQAMRCGASGYVPKSVATEMFGVAIKAVLSGSFWMPDDIALNAPPADDMIARMATLTPQQMRVLMMLSEGLLNKQIAHVLGVSEATVKAHVSAILQKLGVDSRTQAVIAASSLAGGARAPAAHSS